MKQTGCVNHNTIDVISGKRANVFPGFPTANLLRQYEQSISTFSIEAASHASLTTRNEVETVFNCVINIKTTQEQL